jgi:hypothetical protein
MRVLKISDFASKLQLMTMRPTKNFKDISDKFWESNHDKLLSNKCPSKIVCVPSEKITIKRVY